MSVGHPEAILLIHQKTLLVGYLWGSWVFRKVQQRFLQNKSSSQNVSPLLHHCVVLAWETTSSIASISIVKQGQPTAGVPLFFFF